MVFNNIDTDLRDTLQLAETESTLWIKTHTSLSQRITQSKEVESQHYLAYQEDSALQMGHGKLMIINWDKTVIVH